MIPSLIADRDRTRRHPEVTDILHGTDPCIAGGLKVGGDLSGGQVHARPQLHRCGVHPPYLRPHWLCEQGLYVVLSLMVEHPADRRAGDQNPEERGE